MSKLTALLLLVHSLEGTAAVAIKSFQACYCCRIFASQHTVPRIFGYMFSHNSNILCISPRDRSIVVVERRTVVLDKLSHPVTLDELGN